MNEKVSGYVLLGFGLLIIIFSAFNIWSIFTKKSKPVQIFNIPAAKLDINDLVGGNLPPVLASQAGKSANKGLEIFPSSTLSEVANLTAQILLMGFFLNVGYKISLLGVQLVRPIQVKVKGEEN